MYALNVLIFAGLASAISVLSSQAFGAKNYARAGQVYLVGLSCSFLMCVPLGVGVYYTADMVQLILPTTTTELRYNLIQDFAHIMVITLPGQTLAQCTCNFLNAANVVNAPLYIAMFCALINGIFNVAFVHGVEGVNFQGYGFRGSPMSTAATNCIGGVILFVYLLVGNGSLEHQQSGVVFRNALCCRRGRRNGRTGRTGRKGNDSMLEDNENDENDENDENHENHEGNDSSGSGCCHHELCVAYIWQAIPLALGGAFEEWQIQVVGFFAGALGPTATASNNGMQQIFVTLSALNYGIMTATTVRVGYYLGNGNPEKSKSVTVVAFVTSLICGTVIGTCFILCRTFMGALFSIDPAVIELSSTLCWIVGPTYVLLSMFFVSVATLQGQARSGVLAICFLIGAWFVSVPLAWFFAFDLNLNLPGIWYGLVLGYGMIMVLTSVAVYKSDWIGIAKIAVKANRMKESSGGGDEAFFLKY